MFLIKRIFVDDKTLNFVMSSVSINPTTNQKVCQKHFPIALKRSVIFFSRTGIHFVVLAEIFHTYRLQQDPGSKKPV